MANAAGRGGDLEPGRRWQCKQRCHGRLWLLDNRSGFIETHGHEWAVACGPGLSFGGNVFPALGAHRPAASARRDAWVGADLAGRGGGEAGLVGAMGRLDLGGPGEGGGR